MSTAALETAGITKTSVQRLIFLPQMYVNIWGRPLMKCDVVRNADMNKTPDIRTRAFLPRWCAEVKIAYVQPTLSVHSIVSLMQNAGTIVGIGDYRQEKGRGSFGTFFVAGDNENLGKWAGEWNSITAEARDVQQEAFDNPQPADAETRQLLAFIDEERIRRAA
jgi:hypothetical protein